MDKKEFERAVDQEIQWLKYYTLSSSKEQLNINSNIYEDLKSIGYTKRVLSLDRRCPAFILTSHKKIDKNILIDDLVVSGDLRDSDYNRYTPLEIYWIINPNKRLDVINKIIL